MPDKIQKLSDEQLKKMEAAVIKLSEVTHNAQAITLAHNLKMSKNIDEKRKWMVLFYASCFQLLSFMNMSRDNKDDLETFTKKLASSFIQDFTQSIPK